MSFDSAYPVVVFVHVLAATVLIGGSLSSAVARAAVRAATTVEELRRALALAGSAAAASPVAALVLLATGVYLGSAGWWSEPWFLVALAVWVLDAAFPVRMAKAAAMRLGRAAAEAGAGPVPGPLDALRRARGFDLPHDVLLAGDVAMLFVMIVKPGLAGSCAAVALANALVLGARWRARPARAAGLRLGAAGDVNPPVA